MGISAKLVFSAVLFTAAMSGVQAAENMSMAAMSEQKAAAPQQVIHASGVVKAIDLKEKKITIAHEAIPAVNWPAMTMRFTFIQQDASISALKVGDRVNFSFEQQGAISLLQNIQVVKP
ncbi:copper ABC transporter substrate-binding protein [Salmonella enterica subsp. enterica serovar Choleraesuis]|nr:copper ABC transporter substrate-binding protein [Salmonella enterica subsp. enterica serovar Choleraesuis]